VAYDALFARRWFAAGFLFSRQRGVTVAVGGAKRKWVARAKENWSSDLILSWTGFIVETMTLR
jgi:hypothetical protein